MDQLKINIAKRELGTDCMCVCVCLCEARQISLNICRETEALKDAAALLSSVSLACTGTRA